MPGRSLHHRQHPLCVELQLHGDGAAGGRELESVGQQLVDQQLQARQMKGAHVLVRGADKPELQAQQCRGALRLSAQLPDGVHDVPVLEGQGLAAAQVLGCRGQIVHQPQQLVVALVQQGRPGVQLRVLLPLGGRAPSETPPGAGCSGRPADGRRYWQTKAPAGARPVPWRLLSRAGGAMGVACAGGQAQNRGKAWLRHHQHSKKPSGKQEVCRILEDEVESCRRTAWINSQENLRNST